jgi:hypothetical protein
MTRYSPVHLNRGGGAMPTKLIDMGGKAIVPSAVQSQGDHKGLIAKHGKALIGWILFLVAAGLSLLLGSLALQFALGLPAVGGC